MIFDTPSSKIDDNLFPYITLSHLSLTLCQSESANSDNPQRALQIANKTSLSNPSLILFLDFLADIYIHTPRLRVYAYLPHARVSRCESRGRDFRVPEPRARTRGSRSKKRTGSDDDNYVCVCVCIGTP